MLQRFQDFFRYRLRGKQPPHRFTIDRGQWIRGEGLAFSRLLRWADGKKCCLGFYLSSLGFSNEELLDKGSPCLLNKPSLDQRKGQLAWMFEDEDFVRALTPCPTEELWDLIRYNDKLLGDKVHSTDEPMTEQFREKRLIQLFARNDIQVSFIN